MPPRNKFENDCLIYIPSDSSWVAPSQCVWASPVPIPGKAIMSNSYPEDLESFFQRRFRISPAALSTLVQGLRSLANEQSSINQIKGMLWAINTMDPKQNDLASLLTQNILPIRKMRHGTAELSLQNCGADFVVTDRAKLENIFADSATFLDFSLEEVRQLDPLLQALNLSEKYLSHVYTEETSCSDDGISDWDLTLGFKDRAYHLLRYVEDITLYFFLNANKIAQLRSFESKSSRPW